MKCKTFLRSVFATPIFLALILVGFLPIRAKAQKKGPESVPNANKQQLAETYGKLPLSFEANMGQTSEEVKFLSRGSGYMLFLTRGGEALLVLRGSAGQEEPEQPTDAFKSKFKAPSGPRTTVALRMKLAGGTVNPEAVGLEQLPGQTNYFVGNDPQKWRTNVPTYARVNFHDVYPGVDLAYYGNHRQLEYDFIIAPQADPNSITIAVEGAQLSLDAQGNLVLANKDKKIRFQKPLVYQEVDGNRREIPSGYVLKSADQVGFQLAPYDRSRPLIIDPVLAYSTYFGANPMGIAVDSTGNAYLTGSTGSSNFPTTPGAFQTTGPTTPCSPGPGCVIEDAFVTKLNPAGSALVYSTFLGGTYESAGSAIAVDGAGNAYVTGYSYSTDFPTTPGAFQRTRQSTSGYNAFVTELNPTGSALVYSTYLGGNWFDSGTSIAVDASGNAYVTGWTISHDFPTTLGAFQPISRSYNRNAFVTKLNPAGLGPQSLVYSTYLGGSNFDEASGIAVDAQDNAYVTGTSCSSDFPVTPLAFQTVYLGSPSANGPGAGPCNAFVTKLSLSTLALPVYYSTYLGGIGGDEAYGIALDAQDNAYVAGTTCSLNFPVTLSAFQPINHGQCDAFVTKLNATGSALDYSTYLGGTRGDGAYGGIAVDSAGNAYVTGSTNSSDFPTTPDAFETTKTSSVYSWDGFLTVLNPAGLGQQSLVYSTFLGGSCSGAYYNTCNSAGVAVTVDSSGNAYLTGRGTTNFPTTPGAFDTAPADAYGFVAKFSGF